MGGFVRSVLITFDWVVLGYFVLVNTVYFLLLLSAAWEMSHHLLLERGERRWRVLQSDLAPTISVLAPAHNEAATIAGSVKAMLGLSYPNLELVVVNDGSADETMLVLIDEFDLVSLRPVFLPQVETKLVTSLYGSRSHPNLVVVDKENGGKADALNAGLNVASGQLVCSVDADTIIEPDAMMRMVRPFVTNDDVVAAGGTIRIVNGSEVHHGRVTKLRVPRQALAGFQVVEYLRAFLFGRLGWNRLGGNLIISGAFGLFDRQATAAAGGYTEGTVGEDMEMVVRLRRWSFDQKAPKRISFIPDPVAWTEAPESLRGLGRQRDRWHRGLLDVLVRHRGVFLNPRYGVMGLFVYPYFVIVELLAPVIEALGLLGLVTGLLLGQVDLSFALLFFLVAYGLALVLATFTLALEELSFHRYERLSDRAVLVFWILLENLGYRQLTVLWRLRGIWKFLRKRNDWGVMSRRGFAAVPHEPGPSGTLRLMNGTGDQPDDLDVSIRWPQNNTPKAAVPAGRRKSGGRRSPAAQDGGGILSPPAVSPQAVDLALAERIDDLGAALETVTDQISGLSEQTSALRTMIDDRLRPTRAATASGPVRPGYADRAGGTGLDVLAGGEAHLRRLEQIISALSVEVAEVGQILSDEAKAAAEATNEQLRAGFALLGTDVETLAETFADSLAQVGDQFARLNEPETPAPEPATRQAATRQAATRQAPAPEAPAPEAPAPEAPAPEAPAPEAPAPEPAGPGVAGTVALTAEAVSRIEALVEDLLSATENRPTDVSELTASTLQRLGLTVSSKIEATATTAAEAIDSAVDEAIDRAVRQFKEIAPPVVDRSTTAAVTRLEERIASLTQQRDEHDRETKSTLNGLEETIARLASAQAEDLERVLDVLESPATSAVGGGDAGMTRGEDRLARVEAAIESLHGLPKATEDLTDLVAKQFVAFTTQMDAMRRRLTVRSSQGAPISEETLEQLADLITRRMSVEPRKAARPLKAAASKRRPSD